MASHRHFTGVAFNLAQFCMSRNNDHSGYWAVGQIYSFALELGISQVTFNILQQTLHPQTHRFYELNTLYLELLAKITPANGARFIWLKDAVVMFKFSRHHSADKACLCHCCVELTSDLGKTYQATLAFNIRPHDPNKEYRRAIY